MPTTIGVMFVSLLFSLGIVTLNRRLKRIYPEIPGDWCGG